MAPGQTVESADLPPEFRQAAEAAPYDAAYTASEANSVAPSIGTVAAPMVKALMTVWFRGVSPAAKPAAAR